MNNFDFDSAISLYDGGWRSSDKEQLAAEYELTDNETQKICDLLEKLEEKLGYND